jgi:uncharacterized RDD family membrane protein YckC
MDSAHSVSPPGWVPPIAAPAIAPIAPASAPVDKAPDVVIARRLSAAIVDNLILYGAYLALCSVLGWRAKSAGHVLVLVASSLVYFFVMESRDGQTIGKRIHGIRVEAVGGGTAGPGAIALRTALRIADAFPVAHVSGLVTMLHTGPARRQRVGDLAGRTLVVPVDRERPGKASPGWLLPTATILAVFASAVTVFAVANAGNQPLSATYRAQFISGCQQSSGGAVVDCSCVLDRLVADGYDTPNKLNTFVAQVRSAAAAGDPSALPPALAGSINACRR